MSYDCDLFTIGAGSGGVRASRVAAAMGARVTIADPAPLGGTCVNVGCIPKKLMVYASEFSHAFEDARRFGWTLGAPTFDWSTLKSNRDAEIARLNGIYERILHGSGAELIRGRARLLDAHTVEVETDTGPRSYTAERVLVATGGAPLRPTLPGSGRAWVSDDVFSVDTQPERLLVVGGGYIALEMACIFHGLGTRVTLAHRGTLPLRGFDEDVRFFLAEELRKTGVDLRLNTLVHCLEEGPRGDITALLSHEESIDVDAVLYAIGRRANTAGLGLEAIGVALDARSAIVVDEGSRTNVSSIYALGDVTDRINLTPVAIEEAMVFVHNAFGDGPTRTLDYSNIPSAVFSQPPVATVGLREDEVQDAHIYTSEFRPLKHTISGRSERSFMKLVVHPETQRVLGVHLVGDDSGEIIQGFAVALRVGVTKAQLDASVGLHPTAAEELVTMRERRPSE